MLHFGKYGFLPSIDIFFKVHHFILEPGQRRHILLYSTCLLIMSLIAFLTTDVIRLIFYILKVNLEIAPPFI